MCLARGGHVQPLCMLADVSASPSGAGDEGWEMGRCSVCCGCPGYGVGTSVSLPWQPPPCAGAGRAVCAWEGSASRPATLQLQSRAWREKKKIKERKKKKKKEDGKACEHAQVEGGESGAGLGVQLAGCSPGAQRVLVPPASPLPAQALRAAAKLLEPCGQPSPLASPIPGSSPRFRSSCLAASGGAVAMPAAGLVLALCALLQLCPAALGALRPQLLVERSGSRRLSKVRELPSLPPRSPGCREGGSRGFGGALWGSRGRCSRSGGLSARRGVLQGSKCVF